MKLTEVLVKPILTEKANKQQQKLRTYTFKVDKRANKLEIKKAVEEFYHTTINVTVLPRRSADSPELISDYSKARTVLDWEPQYSTLQNIIQSTDEFDSLQHISKRG